MESYICKECGSVYSEDEGCPDQGIAPGTAWSDVPSSFECPDCGAEKDCFSPRKSTGIYVCSMCGFRFEEARGNARAGLDPGTKWSEVPDDFKCPLCGCAKNIFKQYHDDIH